MNGRNKSRSSKVVLSLIIIIVMIFSQMGIFAFAVVSGAESESPKGTDVTAPPTPNEGSPGVLPENQRTSNSISKDRVNVAPAMTIETVATAISPAEFTTISVPSMTPLLFDGSEELSELGTFGKGYKFFGTLGQLIQMKMDSTDLDSYLFFYDSNFELLAYNNDSEGSLDSRIDYLLPSSDYYYIVATQWSSSHGSARLSVGRVDSTITYDANGSLSDPWSEMFASNIPIRIYDVIPMLPGGSYVFRGWTAQRINVVDGANYSGIIYRPRELAVLTGSTTLYALWAYCDNPQLLPFNVQADLEDSAYWSPYTWAKSFCYSFSLDSDQLLEARMDAYVMDAYLVLYDEAGNIVAYNYGSGGASRAILRYSVFEPGTFYLHATTWYNPSIHNGTFSLSVRAMSDIVTLSYDANGGSPAPPAEAYLFGETARISNQLPIRLGYTFMGWNTDLLGNGTYYQRGQVYTSDVNLHLFAIWRPHDYSSYEISAPYTGSSEITPSNPILEANSGKRYSVYRIWLAYGQKVSISMESSDFDSYLYVWGPLQQYVTEGNNSGGNLNAEISFFTNDNGWYYIIATQNSGDSYGSYTLSVKTLLAATISALNALGRPGDNVTVAFSLQDNPGLASLALDIYYDAIGLELEGITSVRRGYALDNLIFTGVNSTTYTNNPFRVSWFSTSNDNSNGDILLVTFRILETAEEAYYCVWANCLQANTRDEGLNLVSVNTQDGGVFVINYIYGDADGDGEVTLGDAIRIAQYINGWTLDIDIRAADVDGDGEVTLADAILIAQYINGWFDKFPVERNVSQPSSIAPFSVTTLSSKILGDNPTVSVINPSEPVKPGETVAVEVKLEGNSGLASLALDISYDENAFELVSETSVSSGPALGNLLFTGLNDVTYQKNPFRVSWFGTENDDSDGVILLIEFKVKDDVADGDYNITVSYSPSNTRDEGSNLVALDTVGASVTVNATITVVYEICYSSLQPVPNCVTLTVGGVGQFYATFNGAIVVSGIKWVVTDSRLATVNANGLVSVNKNKYTGQLSLLLYSSENKLLDSIMLRIT
ncbi:MAG: cohesin domain-containing protein [Oscillospiraceae bacterium]|nr:cohesin domain-containing protein [Oscillospiraceae bacterium]